MQTMKITQVKARVYRAQSKKPITAIQPVSKEKSPESKYVNSVIVKVETSDGSVGYGESMVSAGGDVTGVTTSEVTCQIINGLIAPNILGRDTFEHESLWKYMNRLAGYHGMGGLLLDGVSAVDTALWDLVGKELGQPLNRLMTEDGKQNIHIYGSKIPGISDANQLDSFRANVKDMMGRGFCGIKVGGGLGIKNDALAMKIARELCGDDVSLMLDVFGSYDEAEALALGESIKATNPEWFECPIDPLDIFGYLDLSKKMRLRIALDPIPEINVLRKMLEMNEKFVTLIDVTRDGGITGFSNIAKFSGKLGSEISAHAGWSVTAIGIAASIQMAASFKNLKWMEFRSQYDDNPLSSDITSNSFIVERGQIKVPSFPGIGVKIDEEKLSTYEVVQR